MADQSDVEAALVAAISAALYPSGTDASSALGVTARVYRGWPNAAALDADLAAGLVNVTVFPVEGAMRNTTRWPNDWRAASAAPTLTVSLAASTATFAGAAGAGQLAGVLVDDATYVHRTSAGDTPALVAAMLGAAVGATRPAAVAGASLTVPDTRRFVARTAADGQARRELRRQEQTFRITAWCPTPALRDQTIICIDSALSAVTFLTFADGARGWLRWTSTVTQDKSEDAKLYRRDLLFTVDFPLMQTAMQPSMLFGDLTLGSAAFLA